MVKGLSRRVIVVDSPDPHIFEQAIFIVRNDAAVGSGGVTSQQVVDQAIRIAKDYARTHGAPPRRRLRMSPWLAALLGGAAIGAVWLLAMWVLYCTPACTHPIEHLIAVPFAVLIPAAVIMRRLCSDPRFIRWVDELER